MLNIIVEQKLSYYFINNSIKEIVSKLQFNNSLDIFKIKNQFL